MAQQFFNFSMFGSFKWRGFLFILCLQFFLTIEIKAQDIEPRRWGTLPLGTSVIGAGYLYTNGKISFDPLLEAENVEMDIHSFVVSYIKPFKIFNQKLRFDMILPFSNAKWNGLVSGP